MMFLQYMLMLIWIPRPSTALDYPFRCVATFRKRPAVNHFTGGRKPATSRGLQTLDGRHAAVDEQLLPVHEA